MLTRQVVPFGPRVSLPALPPLWLGVTVPAAAATATGRPTLSPRLSSPGSRGTGSAPPQAAAATPHARRRGGARWAWLRWAWLRPRTHHLDAEIHENELLAFGPCLQVANESGNRRLTPMHVRSCVMLSGSCGSVTGSQADPGDQSSSYQT